MPKEIKTNVMRLLDKAKVQYDPRFYDPNPKLTGSDIAGILGEDHNQVFKTLVAVGKSNEHYAFLIPVDAELNLKKAAKATGEKSIEMIPLKQLLPLTGYVHGGCSPIGMKKRMKHYIDSSALDKEKIFISGGRLGSQVGIKLTDAIKVAELIPADLKD